ncbi:DUF6941 family protein [Prosthecobacter sp.]|uniref:DUF6941 family protein n=1 Tax=Prosthecobacter sp. TaxID=1965333 RepID=UPI003782F1D2
MNIQLAIVCDFAADYQGKLCIQGAFDTLCAQTFPVMHPQCFIAVRIIFQTEDAGKHEFLIRCVDPEGKEFLPPVRAQMEVTFPSAFIPFVSRNIVFPLHGLKFKRQGIYRWLVQQEDETLASIPLRVTLFDERRSATGPAG